MRLSGSTSKYRMAEEPANSFKELPMEVGFHCCCSLMQAKTDLLQVNWHIACFIESDQDLCTFYLLCRSTHDALDGHNMSFWRARFLSRFDKPDWTECENAKYKEAYKKRRQALMYGARFDRALARHEPYDVKKATKVLEVLRDVIIGKCCFIFFITAFFSSFLVRNVFSDLRSIYIPSLWDVSVCRQVIPI